MTSGLPSSRSRGLGRATYFRPSSISSGSGQSSSSQSLCIWTAPVSRHTQAELPNSALELRNSNASRISFQATGIGVFPRASETAIDHAASLLSSGDVPASHRPIDKQQSQLTYRTLIPYQAVLTGDA